jgi:hypothetical protein
MKNLLVISNFVNVIRYLSSECYKNKIWYTVFEVYPLIK